MRPLYFVVDGLADVVQQPGALGQHHVHAQLRGHHAGQMGNLHRMAEHILSVAGTVAQASQKFYHLRMYAVDTGLKGGLLARFLYALVDFTTDDRHRVVNYAYWSNELSRALNFAGIAYDPGSVRVFKPFYGRVDWAAGVNAATVVFDERPPEEESDENSGASQEPDDGSYGYYYGSGGDIDDLFRQFFGFGY